MTLFHGGTDIVNKPRIIRAYKGRDFGAGWVDIKEVCSVKACFYVCKQSGMLFV